MSEINIHSIVCNLTFSLRRTGAGKSSIMVALYRLVEACQGSIDIDDVDISKLDLQTLRQSIAIIPQEAVSLARISCLRYF